MDEILSDLSQSRTVFDEKAASFNDYKIFSIIGELKAEIADLKNGQIRELEKRIASLQSENQNIRKDCDGKIAALQTQVHDMKKIADSLQIQNQEIRKDFDGKIAGLQTEIRELEKLKTAVAELGEKKKALKEFVEILNISGNEVKKNVEGLKNEHQKMKEMLNRLAADIDTIDSLCKAYPYKNNVLFPKNEHRREQE